MDTKKQDNTRTMTILPSENKSNFIKAALGTILIFGTMTLYVFEFAYLQNTFNVFKLVGGSMLIGFIIGLLLGQNFKKRFKDEDERRVIAVGFPVLIALLFPLMTSLMNRKLNFNPPKQEQVEFFKFEGFGGSRVGFVEGMEIEVDGYSIFFIRDKNIKRIRSKQPYFKDKKEGEKIILPISKGVLGFEYVEL